MAARQTLLQQLRLSKKKDNAGKYASMTPLTESQSDPQLSKLAGMRALQRTPQANPNWASSILNPNQLTLNDAPGGENFYNELRASANAMRDRAMSNFTVIEDNQKKKRVDVSGDNVLQALKQSSLPNQAMEALGTTVVASNRVDDGAAAAYAASRNSRNDALRRGHLEINSAEITNTNQGTLARHINHELGHLAENLTRGEIGQNIEPRVSDKEWLEHSNYASASGEGFADGIALRFGSAPQESSFPPNSVNDPNNHGLVGYKPENWSNPQNQVAYTAHRAHAWSTGELPTGSLPERIHTMGANPAVRDALRQVEQRQRLNHVSRSPHNPPESSGPVFDQDTQVHGPDRRLSGYVPITDVAKNLSQQFMNTRKTGRQLSLLGEQNEYDTYDVDKVDWDS